jgi:nucleoside-diphosphate-sugar epimerase
MACVPLSTRNARLPPRIPGVEWLPGDLEDLRALDALVAGTDAVVHCAGVVRGARRSDFDRVNAEGAGRLAQAAARQARMPRFLLISSLAARMPGLSPYAASKWQGECAVKAASATMRWTVLRPPVVFGPGDRELLPLFRCIAKGFAPLPAGPPGRFSLLYVDDLATAVMRWLEADTGYGQTLNWMTNPGDTIGTRWRALPGECCTRRPVRRVSIPAPPRPCRPANLASPGSGYAPMLTRGVREITHPDWLCDSRAFALATGWRPAWAFDAGLAHAYGKRPPPDRDYHARIPADSGRAQDRADGVDASAPRNSRRHRSPRRSQP